MPEREVPEQDRALNGNSQKNGEELLRQRQLAVLEEAEALARAHYEVEPGIRAIYRIEGPDPTDLRIRLLEVNEQTVPAGIMPVGFPPHPPSGLHFPSVIIEVTPQEYEAIESNALQLPAGWIVRNDYKRPASADLTGESS